MTAPTHPRCQATLKDGSRCRTHAAPGGDYCAYHQRLRELVRTGEILEKPSAQEFETTSVEEAEAQEPRQSQPSEVKVADVRARLARDAAEEYEVLRDALLQALKAEREAFATCPNCHKRHPLIVPDWTARVKAVETLLNQGFGQRREPEPEVCDCQKQLARVLELARSGGTEDYFLASAFHRIEQEAYKPIQQEAERIRGQFRQVLDLRERGELASEATAHLPSRKEVAEDIRLALAELLKLDEQRLERIAAWIDRFQLQIERYLAEREST